MSRVNVLQAPRPSRGPKNGPRNAILKAMGCSTGFSDIRNGIFGCELPLEPTLVMFLCWKMHMLPQFQWKSMPCSEPTQGWKNMKISILDTKEQRWGSLDSRNGIFGYDSLRVIRCWLSEIRISEFSPRDIWGDAHCLEHSNHYRKHFRRPTGAVHKNYMTAKIAVGMQNKN